MRYYAIQSKDPGYIEYVTAAEHEQTAFRAFDDHVGIDPHEEGLDVIADRYDCTELTADEYDRLQDCDGTDQKAIDYLEAIKKSQTV